MKQKSVSVWIASLFVPVFGFAQSADSLQPILSDPHTTYVQQAPQSEIRGVPYEDQIRDAKSYDELAKIRQEILERADLTKSEKTALFETVRSETEQRLDRDLHRQQLELAARGAAGIVIQTVGYSVRMPVLGDALVAWGQGIVEERKAVEILDDAAASIATGILFRGIGERLGKTVGDKVLDRVRQGGYIDALERRLSSWFDPLVDAVKGSTTKSPLLARLLNADASKTVRRVLKEISRKKDNSLTTEQWIAKQFAEKKLDDVIVSQIEEAIHGAADEVTQILVDRLLIDPLFGDSLSETLGLNREVRLDMFEYGLMVALANRIGGGFDEELAEVRKSILDGVEGPLSRADVSAVLDAVESGSLDEERRAATTAIGNAIGGSIQRRLEAVGYPAEAISAAVETALRRLAQSGDRLAETAEDILRDLEQLEESARALGDGWANTAESSKTASVLAGAIGSLVNVLSNIDWENIGKEFFVPVSDLGAVKAYAEAGIISTHWPGIPSPAYGSRFSACDKKAIFGMGLLAGDVYHDGDARAPDGYRTVNDTGELERLLGKDSGFSVDNNGQITKSGLGWFSGFDASIYEAPDGSLVLAFRGTTSVSDGWADLFQWAPWTPDQYSLAASMLRSLLGNTDKKIAVVGHSLGGALTQYAMAENDLDGRVTGYTFNSAGLSWSTIKGLDKDRADEAGKNLVNVRNDGDGVSPIGWHLGQIYDVENQNSSGHGLGKSMDVWYHPERATSVEELEPVYDGFLGNLQKAADGGAGVCPCGSACACNPCRNLRKAEPSDNPPSDDEPADDTGGVDDGGPPDSSGDADVPDDDSSTDPSGSKIENDDSHGSDGLCPCSVSVAKRAELEELKKQLEVAEQKRISAENQAKNIWWKLLAVVLEPFPGLMEKAGGVVAGDWGEETIKGLNRAAQMWFDGEIDVKELATTVLESLKIGLEHTLAESDKKSSWWKWICHPIDTISEWVDKLEGALEYGKKLGETIAEIVISREELEKAENQLKDITNRFKLAVLEFSANGGCYCAPGCQCPHCKHDSGGSGSGEIDNPPEDDDPWTGGGGWGCEPPVDVIVIPGVGGSEGGDYDGLGDLVSELGRLLDGIGDGSGLVDVTIPDFGLSGSDSSLVPDSIGDPDIAITASGLLNTGAVNGGGSGSSVIVDGNKNGGGSNGKRKPGDIGGRQKEIYSRP